MRNLIYNWFPLSFVFLWSTNATWVYMTLSILWWLSIIVCPIIVWWSGLYSFPILQKVLPFALWVLLLVFIFCFNNFVQNSFHFCQTISQQSILSNNIFITKIFWMRLKALYNFVNMAHWVVENILNAVIRILKNHLNLLFFLPSFLMKILQVGRSGLDLCIIPISPLFYLDSKGRGWRPCLRQSWESDIVVIINNEF